MWRPFPPVTIPANRFQVDAIIRLTFFAALSRTTAVNKDINLVGQVKVLY